MKLKYSIPTIARKATSPPDSGSKCFKVTVKIHGTFTRTILCIWLQPHTRLVHR